ncbi:MAG: hypothetical protein IPN53_11800, partial [Comamonadaceae bacterium]|nr:hypothetical protein [Comamonadaceae bacterium]
FTDRLKDANVNTVTLFNSASAATGQANASLFYLDYGGFRILANGLRDTAFVDATIDVPGKDCVAGSSGNTDSDPDAARELFGCVLANQNASPLVGRFYPNVFLLNSSSMVPACSNVTYEGQAFGINATVSAMSSGTVVAAVVMPRYTAGVVVLGAENNNSGVNLSTRLALNQAPAPSWTNGVYAITAPAATFGRAAAPDGAFDLLDIGISVTDATDGVTLGTPRNMRPADATACTSSTCTHQKLNGAPIKMRFGRVRLQNAFGSEKLALSVPVQAQYWNGSYFVSNSLDSCTALSVPAAQTLASGVSPAGTAGLYFYPVDTAANGKNKLTSTDTVPTLASPLTAGQSTLQFPAPQKPGWLDLILDVPDYLKYNWGNCSGQGTDALPNDFPCARATFGIFGTNSPILYRRENY